MDALWQAATSGDALAWGAGGGVFLGGLAYLLRSIPLIAQRWIAWRRERDLNAAEADSIEAKAHAKSDAKVLRMLEDSLAHARALMDDVAALSVEVSALRGRLAEANKELDAARAEIDTLRGEVKRRLTPPGGTPAAPKEK